MEALDTTTRIDRPARRLPSHPRVTTTQIKAAVARRYHLHPSTMTTHGRGQALSRPRQIAMYLSVNLTKLSLRQIAERFSRHHSSVIDAVRSVDRLIGQNPDVRHAVEQLKQELLA